MQKTVIDQVDVIVRIQIKYDSLRHKIRSRPIHASGKMPKVMGTENLIAIIVSSAEFIRPAINASTENPPMSIEVDRQNDAGQISRIEGRRSFAQSEVIVKSSRHPVRAINVSKKRIISVIVRPAAILARPSFDRRMINAHNAHAGDLSVLK